MVLSLESMVAGTRPVKSTGQISFAAYIDTNIHICLCGVTAAASQ